MNDRHVILASQSPRRRELLSLLGIPFEVTSSDVREIPRADETPVELVTRLSRAKALDARLNGHKDGLVIACDTIVALGDRSALTDVLGKPRDAEEATTMLRRLRGRSHVVYSAVTLRHPSHRMVTDLISSQVTMRSYREAEIRAYVATEDPLDKAGAYAIQHGGFDPVEEIEGCYASVMGLPLCHVASRLRRWGVDVPTDVPAACQAHTGHSCRVYREIITSL